MRVMKNLCGVSINVHCRDRAEQYFNLGPDSQMLWDDASECVNKTFTSSNWRKVDYTNDENPVLE